MSNLSSRNVSLGPLSFEALKRCFTLFGVHPQTFGLWELRQDPRHSSVNLDLADLTKLISLIFGKNFHIFSPPGVDVADPAYPVEVIKRHDRFFGPYPMSCLTLADDDRLETLTMLINSVDKRTPFKLASPREIAKEDRDFILKLMKLDPRDRPSAKELLQDAWLREQQAADEYELPKMLAGPA